MDEQHTPPPKSIKRENLFIAVFIALVIGFILGFAYGVYQSGAPIHGLAELKPDTTRQADFQAMIETTLEETQAHPDNAETWITLGNLYYDAQQPEKAIPAYQKALALDPDSADVWSDLGVMFRQSGQPEKAVETFERAILINPAHQTAMYNKGIVLMHDLKNEALALDAWKALVQVNPLAKTPNGMLITDMIAAMKQQP